MPPRPPHHHAWLENEERVRRVADVAERLRKIGELLGENGSFRLGASDVRPPDECLFIVRLERKPRGELALKLELVWEEHEASSGRPASGDLEIRATDG